MTTGSDYITRCAIILREMLDERDDDGNPVWQCPGPYTDPAASTGDRNESERRFHDEMCYRLRLRGEAPTQMRMLGKKSE